MGYRVFWCAREALRYAVRDGLSRRIPAIGSIHVPLFEYP